MKFGILGLPGAGKSTLFDLLTESRGGGGVAQAPNKPRFKVVKVEDARLEPLRNDYQPRKCTPPSLEIVDFPALTGERERAGLAELLAPAREMDALFVVIRGFEAVGFPPRDVRRDFEEIHAELILSDLVLVEKRLERLEAKSRKPNFSADDRKERGILEHLKKSLEAESSLSTVELSVEERRRVSGFGFLSAKPQVVVVNVGDLKVFPQSEELRVDLGPEVHTVSARSELEILELDEEDRQPFLDEYGITELSRSSLIASGYRAAGCISFFTVSKKEVRAWTIRDGHTALEAAALVHTDMARGFIRAEVVSFDDYVRYGGVKGARDKGHLRLEGKEYVVADGDVIEFRFSV